MNGETNGENAHQNRDVNQAHGQQHQQQPYQAHHPAPVPQQNDYNGKLQESTQLGESSIYGGQSQLLQSQRAKDAQHPGGMQESEPSQSHYEIPNQQPRQDQFQNAQPPNEQLRNRGYADYEDDQKKQKQYQDQPVHEPRPKGYSNDHKEFLNKKASNYNLVCSLEHDKKFLLTRKRELTAQKKLFFVSCICFLFMIMEAVCGYISGSIAVLADAAHMFSDVAGFMISFFSIYISSRKMTLSRNYGYHRAEVLGALLSVFFIWALLIWLNWSATNRILYPERQADINAQLMLITACFGLACNVLNLCALNFFCNPEDGDDEFPDEEISDIESEKPAKQIEMKSQSSKSSRTLAEQMKGIYKPRHARSFQRKEQKNAGTMTNILPETRQQLIDEHEAQVAKKGDKVNLNQRAATIHLLGDMVQSIGVVSAAIIIYFKPEYKIADPICTYLFSILVLMTTVPIFNECVKMIMEAGPDEIDTLALYNELLAIKTVQEIHDFHCWQLAGSKYVATLHVRSRYQEKVISDINKICSKDDYQIYHVTVQVEPEVAIGSHISCSHQCTVDKDQKI